MLIEKQVDYAVQCVGKLQRERLRSMEVKKEAVMDYDEYLRVSGSIRVLVRLLYSADRWTHPGIRIQAYFPKVRRLCLQTFGVPY